MTPALKLRELGEIRIASPCKVPWSSMKGDATTRFCGACKLNVYNLENLDHAEIRALWLKNEGRMCVRLFRRFDGTILTRDCPKGWRLVKKIYRDNEARARRSAWPAVFTVLLTLLLFSAGVVTLFGDNIRRLFSYSAGGI
jgi:hypothetical protein